MATRAQGVFRKYSRPEVIAADWDDLLQRVSGGVSHQDGTTVCTRGSMTLQLCLVVWKQAVVMRCVYMQGGLGTQTALQSLWLLVQHTSLPLHALACQL